MRYYYCDSLSHTENLAQAIWVCLNNIKNTKIASFESFTNYSINNALNFEIVNDFHGKNVFFSYVLKPDFNLSELEHHMTSIGIDNKFSDKSIPSKKRYLTVWAENDN